MSTKGELIREVRDVISDVRRDEEKRQSLVRHFLAGGAAGALSRTAVMPLTVIKNVAQLSVAESWRETARSMYRAGGARIFWVGNVPGLIRIVPHAGLKLALFDVFAHRYARGTEKHVYRNRFLSGTAAGGMASVLLYPLDVLKSTVTHFKFVHLAEGRPVPSLAWLRAARELYQHGGATRGMAISAVGGALHNGFLFLGYASLRSW